MANRGQRPSSKAALISPLPLMSSRGFMSVKGPSKVWRTSFRGPTGEIFSVGGPSHGRSALRCSPIFQMVDLDAMGWEAMLRGAEACNICSVESMNGGGWQSCTAHGMEANK
jgi:hypothetical protein